MTALPLAYADVNVQNDRGMVEGVIWTDKAGKEQRVLLPDAALEELELSVRAAHAWKTSVRACVRACAVRACAVRACVRVCSSVCVRVLVCLCEGGRVCTCCARERDERTSEQVIMAEFAYHQKMVMLRKNAEGGTGSWCSPPLACTRAYLLACLPACMLACMSVCLLPVCLPAFLILLPALHMCVCVCTCACVDSIRCVCA